MNDATQKTRGVSLLIVEDEDQAREMMMRAVGMKYPGLTLHVAQNGAAGLESYRRHHPEIIITDVSMPVLDGIKMSREIKAENRDALIAAVTAHSDSSFLLSAIEIGINHYLLKPINHRQLFTLLDKLIDEVLLKRLVTDQHAYIRKLSRAVEQSQSMVAITDRKGRVEFVNRKFCEFTGFAADELIGREHRMLTHGGGEMVGEEVWRSIEAGTEWRGEVTSRKKNGEIYHALASISPLKDDDGSIVNVVLVKQDITASKRQEAEIGRLKNYLADIVNSMPSVLVGLDPQAEVTQWNRQAEVMTGLSARVALGASLKDVLPHFSDKVHELLKEMEADRQPKSAERLVLMRGEEPFFYDMILYPLSGSGREGAVLKIDDVTERVRTQELMLQTEKMASLGRLAFGLAHEVNNPLHAISQASANIERRLSGDAPANAKAAEKLGIAMPQLQGYFKERQIGNFTECIREATAQAADIVNSILRLSHAERAPMEPADPVEVAERALELASRRIPLKRSCAFSGIVIERDYEKGLPAVPMVAVEIEQVLLNLFNNSAQSMCDNKETRRPRLKIVLRKEEQYLAIEVEDNGSGMPEGVRQRVFEPFFSTKDVGEGTGLGLSVSFWIVTQIHKGKMAVASEPGAGTRVTMKLPLT